ncbi:MAG: hypothetical protein DWQ34_09285 [Planctomycetota bacterium]|nr:MAG: hypothetical protein DWQ34_09285 [Planctomycetota bacterium]REK20234.1 MAG: hypothetical protein DWQ41_26210 [Planctomycetota bacterium]REK35312.1 MAG: hypothetical protein DWQ45_11310 [Planctomycetota bacterium]
MTSSAQSPPASSQNSAANPIRDRISAATLRHNIRQSKATNWMAMMTSFVTGQEAENQRRNREAEDAWVRRALWGNASPTSGSETDDDMAKYVMGDNTETVNHHHHPPRSGLGTLARAGLAAALITGGVAAGLAVPLVLELLKPGPSTTEIIDYDVQSRLIPPQ